MSLEKITEPMNPFDEGTPVNHKNLKALRDAILELAARIKVLEPAEVKEVEEEKPKKVKKNA